jgi:hypothetical protein
MHSKTVCEIGTTCRSENGASRLGLSYADISVCETNFRKASVETLGGGLRTSRPTSRRAFAYPARVGLVVLNQPPSKPMIFDQETAC